MTTLTPSQIQSLTKAAAEVDGWVFWSKPHYGHDHQWHCSPHKGKDVWDSDISEWAGEPENIQYDLGDLPNYTTSYDAIIPAIVKYCGDDKHKTNHFFVTLCEVFYGSKTEQNNWRDLQIMAKLFATPLQLTIAFVSAVGRMPEGIEV